MRADDVLDLHREGLAALRWFDQHSAHHIATVRDVGVGQARRWKQMAARFLDSCASASIQREALEDCRRLGHSLERLEMIDSHARRARDRRLAWRIRGRLCALEAPFDDVKQRAVELVTELVSPKPVELGLRVTQTRQGTRSVTWRAGERDIADVLLALDNDVAASEELMALRLSEARGRALRQHLLGARDREYCSGPAGDSAVAETSVGGLRVPVLRTMVIVGLNDYVKILAGQGDDVPLALTDGTTMTGAEFLARIVNQVVRSGDGGAAPSGRAARNSGGGASVPREDESSQKKRTGTEVSAGPDVHWALFHPTRGGVNTYTARFANAKQRDLATAEHPVCAWPGCHVPGYLCQIHHIRAHAHNGATSPENLVPLCRYHNGCNDDPHAPPRRGRMERRRDGTVQRRGPTGQWERNTHPATRLGAMSIVGGAASGDA